MKKSDFDAYKEVETTTSLNKLNEVSLKLLTFCDYSFCTKCAKSGSFLIRSNSLSIIKTMSCFICR